MVERTSDARWLIGNDKRIGRENGNMGREQSLQVLRRFGLRQSEQIGS